MKSKCRNPFHCIKLKELEAIMKNQPIKYKPSEKGEITTHIRRKKKPHNKFVGILRFDSEPTELTIEAGKTDVDVKDLTPNPKKFSFGKIVASNKNTLEFFMYPLSSLDHVYVGFKKDISAKGHFILIEKRKEKEFWNLLNKIRYFRRLSMDRKLKYLQKPGFSANININRG